MKEGFYELLKSEELEQAIAESGLGEISEKLDLKTSSRHLAEVITEEISNALAELQNNGGTEDEKILRQLDILNELLVYARQVANLQPASPYQNPPSVLRALHRPQQNVNLPQVGMAQPWLFTSGKDSPALFHELKAELSSCQHVDILMSFITMSGVRKIINLLRDITAVDAHQQSRTSLRIITTTYTGATDLKAVKMLAELPNCQVKISLDGRRNRLHAKAWIFERDTGFGSAYVGSANLSGAALMGGLEWTVKFTERGQNFLYQRARAHFETLWQDEEFQRFDPNNETHEKELRGALARERGVKDLGENVITTFFDIQAKPFQQIILDQLANERAHGRFRNLLVAATGTGKTVMAALDYKRICQQQGGQPKVLFLAHRKEILQQSLQTFRHVLRDGSFGDYLADRHEPESKTHLFATIQSVNSRQLVDELGSDFWNIVIIDECHHIEANSFRRLIKQLNPKYLLGLTATPERSDGLNILQHFDLRPDGTPSAQMRLWHALEQQLLAPFEYYACADGVDYSGVNWRSANETAQLEQLLTGETGRAIAVLRAWEEHVSAINECRALAFCVSVAHAEFMTQFFQQHGINAALVTGQTPSSERAKLPAMLERREINVIVTVDLYNEGVDLPFVDTLLLLRPTQSATLFQQQIGRGLRLFEGKDSCLILDFVGQYSEDFRFDVLYSSLTGLSKREVIDGIDHGFGSLPPGCYLQMQKQAREQILNSLRYAVNLNWRRLQTELTSYRARHGAEEIHLAEFVREQALEFEDIYRKNGASGWTRLKRDTQLIAGAPTELETKLNRRFKDVLHIDDPDYLNVMRAIGKGSLGDDEQSRKYALMLAYQICGGQGIQTIDSFVQDLARTPELLSELVELADALDARTNEQFSKLPGLESTGLKLHSAYKIREVLTALDYYTETNYSPFQAGV
ncbi:MULTISPECIES: DEAD/DEAH box helicase family protein [Pseudidiomarina]|uniref:Superfamily II DNA or RNA helicase n=2 Tax=Pseudidiomarina TaxID=2800384 RepID=A0A368V0C3_9GAMM|nr:MULTISPECIES: DEAD/DEAH box helicase family protein [Pseudidiomarina]PWW14217.1 superfamily II DNA or RNA helicase [Pseudidiomarina maritima]RBP92031.1 superfamily II DNA or RNA helicase [Pseudidiomarina tainanensis]RCW33795.1 superfamily II DNA or RNA helicase [Pseudidiomarina tainanensis]